MLRAVLNLKNTACPVVIQRVVLAFSWGCIWTVKRVQAAITVRKWLPPFHQSEVASLCKSVATNYPFKKVLELGIGLGQTLEVLSWILPDVKFTGVSNDTAKIFRLQPFYTTRANVELVKEELDSLQSYADGSFDVSYTCGVLSYYDRNEAALILKEMRRVTSGSIFLLELQALNEYDAETRFYDAQGHTNLWVRDYAGFVAEVLGSNSESESVICDRVQRPLWENIFWRNYGSVVTIENRQ